MSKSTFLRFLSISLALFSTSQPVLASYEFLLPWSAKEMSLGGAGTAISDGSQALFFNPAGLAHLKNSEIQVSFSPYIIKSSGPYNYTAAGYTVNQSTPLSPNGAIFWGTKVDDKLGVGVGIYTSAGATNDYGVIDLSSLGAIVQPQLQGNLVDVEASVGAGYQVTPELSLGAAWRVSFASSYLKTVNTAFVTSLNIDGLSATQFAGFRFGAQYKPVNGPWGLGVSFRTAVPLNLKNGTTSGVNLKTNTPLAGGDGATETTSLPLQLLLGGYYDVLSNWKFVFQYDFTQYTALKAFNVAGTIAATPFSVDTLQNWNNQHTLRFGSEITGVVPVPIRVGYLHSFQIVPTDRATTSFATPPGGANAIVIGTGGDLSDRFHLDGAANYVWASGQGINTIPLPGQPAGFADGSYGFTGYNFHTTLSYAL